MCSWTPTFQLRDRNAVCLRVQSHARCRRSFWFQYFSAVIIFRHFEFCAQIRFLAFCLSSWLSLHKHVYPHTVYVRSDGLEFALMSWNCFFVGGKIASSRAGMNLPLSTSFKGPQFVEVGFVEYFVDKVFCHCIVCTVKSVQNATFPKHTSISNVWSLGTVSCTRVSRDLLPSPPDLPTQARYISSLCSKFLDTSAIHKLACRMCPSLLRVRARW